MLRNGFLSLFRNLKAFYLSIGAYHNIRQEPELELFLKILVEPEPAFFLIS